MTKSLISLVALLLSAFATSQAKCQISTPSGPETAPQAQSAASLPSARIPAAPPTFTGGDGTSMENAIVVNAANEVAGVRGEYAWLREHFAGYKRTSQALLQSSGKSYDVLEIESPTGGKQKVYFDISAFYGKL